VTALARTRDGYLWVGTYGGLARFDGVRFVQYGLAEGLRSLNIRALLADDEGGVWVATLGGGLSRVRKDGTITTLTTANGLAHDDVTAIARADGGGVWVATAKGLQRWTPGGASCASGRRTA
jgi:ligand-binding sensor domain-containing protein